MTRTTVDRIFTSILQLLTALLSLIFSTKFANLYLSFVCKKYVIVILVLIKYLYHNFVLVRGFS